MVKRNRVLQVAMCIAVALVPVGMLLAQEVTAPAAGGETIIMKSSSGPVQVRSSGRSFSLPPGAMPAPSSGPGKPPSDPPSKPPGKPPSKSPSKPDEKKGKPGEEKKSEGDSETVKRPTTPPEPVDPEIIRKMRLDKDGKVRLNFTGHPWRDVLGWLANLSGLSLDWQELPGDYLNLITQKKYTLSEVRDMINRHLLARGYTMLRPEGSLWVVKIEKLNPGMVPRVEPDELDKRDPHEFVKVNFALKWMMAHQAVEELKPLLSSHAKLTALSTSNRVEAIDAVINLRELRRFLEDEQSTESQEELVREFPLKHVRAEEIKEQVLALLGMPSSGGGGGGGGASSPTNPAQMQQMKQMQEQMKKMAAQAAAAAKKTGGGGTARPPEGRVSLIVNKRKNSILARAPPDKMMIIDQTITALDVSGSDSPADYVARHQVYRLETIDPAPVVKTLLELGDLDPRTRLEVDTVNQAIIAYADLLDHATIQMLVIKLDGGGRRCHVIPLVKLRAESVAQTVTYMIGGGKKDESKSPERSRSYSPFGIFGYSPSRGSSISSRQASSDQFRVEPDVRNNALVLWANEFELKKVEELLKELRLLPPREGEAYTVHVYRLASIDPEAVVKTLTDMDTVGPRATLEVDAANKAIIAYASADEHKKISDLLQKLDGSARDFFVRHLRQLEADSVAGTIEFMFGGGEKKEQYLSRYDYYPYTDRMRPNASSDTDAFRVDADLEFNRLLIWANEVELKAVENLLVKLGEIPEEGGSPDTVRVLDTGGGAELKALIERIRRTWTAPNPLIVIPPEEPEETAPKEQPGEPAASPPRDTTAGMTQRPLFRLVRFNPDDGAPDGGAEVSRGPVEVDTGAEVAPAPAAGVETPPAPGKADAGAETPPGPATSVPGADAPAVPPESDPGASASPGPAEDTAKPPPPVTISWGPDGRVVIECEDPKVLDALEEVLNRHAPPRRDYKVFPLKYALATWVAFNLEAFFEEEDKQGAGGGRYYDPYWGGYRYGSPNTGNDKGARLSKRRPVKFISDSDTNTILVQNADAGQLKTIEDLIKLYDAPEPRDTQSLRITEIVPLLYSKAAVVEKALKDVYRDLLSPNDRTLKEGQPKPERSVTYNFGDGGSVTKYPRWKGLLSIGVDELSNSLIVSAPTYLFNDVKAKITALDEAARPVSTVRVMKIDGRLSAAGLQAKLSQIMGGGSGRRPPSGRSSSPSKPPGGPPRPPGGPSRSSTSTSTRSYNSR